MRTNEFRPPLKSWHSWLFLALGGLACYWAWRQVNPPAALPETAAADEFSAGRARKHVEQIARAPHPAGSAENARVRDYILGQLRALGIEGSAERLTSFIRQSGVAYRGGVVENIAGRIPGSANSRAVMLACHYDSVVGGPGASDDGHGVATLLETARALRHGPATRNDILLLFTDAEEPALMGGEAFMTQSARHAEPALVLNFDARGVRGPALMFETSQPDGALIREFGRAAPYPRAASFLRHVYERMPSGTDFAWFRMKGLAGLNFAFIEGGQFYHTSEDRPGRLDEGTVQHQGSYALSLARHFGNLKLPLEGSSDRAYFNVGNVLISHPLGWVWGVEAALLILTAGAFAAWRRRAKSSGAAVLWAAAATMGAIAAGGAAGYGYLRLLRAGAIVNGGLSFGQEYGGGWFLAALAVLSGMITIGLTTRMARRFGRFETVLGATLVQELVALYLCAKFPAASYLASAGALSGLLLLGLLLAAPRSPAAWVAGGVASLIPAILLWTPAARFLDSGLGTGAWPVQGLLVADLMILASAALFLPSGKPWRSIVVTGLAAAGLVGAGMAANGYDTEHPRATNVFYALDADRQSAFWASRQRAADPWSAAVLGPNAKREAFPQISSWLGGETFWRSPAPVFPLPAPEAEVAGEECRDDFRQIDLRVRSKRGALGMLVLLQSDRATELVQLNGRAPTLAEEATPPERRTVYIDLLGLPREGMILRARIRGCGKLVVRLVERSNDLSAVFPGGVPALPPGVMTAWEEDYYNRSVMVTRVFSF